MSQSVYDEHQFVSTGMPSFDAALGGGLPRGRIVELFGPEGVGKSAVAARCCIGARQCGAERVVWIGCGDIAPPVSGAAIHATSGAHAMDECSRMVKAGVSLIVVEGVMEALEHEARAEFHRDVAPGIAARIASRWLRTMTAQAHRSGTTVLFTTDLRQKIAEVFGGQATAAGGNALKFYASVRVDVRRAANETVLRVVKNKCGVPFKVARLSAQTEETKVRT